MPRYYRRRYNNYRSKKYKWEQVQVSTRLTIANNEQSSVPVVPPDSMNGVRGVKHLKITLLSPFTGVSNPPAITAAIQFYWALIYVPEGYSPQELTVPQNANSSAPLYSANQFVMASGIQSITSEPVTLRSPLSRNLNSGDAIFLVIHAISEASPATDYQVRTLTTYSICYK